MKETFKHIEDSVIREVGSVTRGLEKQALYYRKSVLHRFPFLIIGLSTFGVVAVLYGFEKMIDSVPLLSENPIIIMVTGFIALAVTGTLYKKLS